MGDGELPQNAFLQLTWGSLTERLPPTSAFPLRQYIRGRSGPAEVIGIKYRYDFLSQTKILAKFNFPHCQKLTGLILKRLCPDTEFGRVVALAWR